MKLLKLLIEVMFTAATAIGCVFVALWATYSIMIDVGIAPKATEERYRRHPLPGGLTEHTSVRKEGRYTVICLWLTTGKDKETKVLSYHCSTEREIFNGR